MVAVPRISKIGVITESAGYVFMTEIRPHLEMYSSDPRCLIDLIIPSRTEGRSDVPGYIRLNGRLRMMRLVILGQTKGRPRALNQNDLPSLRESISLVEWDNLWKTGM